MIFLDIFYKTTQTKRLLIHKDQTDMYRDAQDPTNKSQDPQIPNYM